MRVAGKDMGGPEGGFGDPSRGVEQEPMHSLMDQDPIKTIKNPKMLMMKMMSRKIETYKYKNTRN